MQPKSFHLASISCLVLLLSFTHGLRAQLPNPVSFNTAVDSSLTGTIPLDSLDLSWTTSTVSINGPYVKAVRASNQTAWLTSPFPTANWITYPHKCSSNPVQHSCVGNMDEYYRLMFQLPATACDSVNKPGGYCLTMNFYADNCVYEIFVNGFSSYLYTGTVQPTLANSFSSGKGTTVSLCDHWKAGTNTLVVNVKSGPPTDGFLAFVTASATTSGAQISTSVSHTNATCFGAADGAASVSVTGYTGQPVFSWLPTGGTGHVANNLTAGIYTVHINMPSCDITRIVNITQPTGTAVTISTVAPQCAGSKFTFSASGGTSYTWTPGNITGSVLAISPTVTTTYTLTGTDSAGCSVSHPVTANVLNCTGTPENMNSTAIIFLDDAGMLSVSVVGQNSYEAELFDLTGQIHRSEIFEANTKLNLNGLPRGLYFLRLKTENTVIVKRVMAGQ